MPQAKQRVAVIGCGIYGANVQASLSAYNNVDVIGIEQFSLRHALGSSHGGTRISRFSNFEGEGYVEPAILTARIFENLQQNSRIADHLMSLYGETTLFKPNGTLIMGPAHAFNKEAHGVKNPIIETVMIAQRALINHKILQGREIREMFPAFQIDEDDLNNTVAYFEPDSGTLFPERCVAAQLEVARLNGARIIENRRVVDLDAYPTTKKLTLDNGDVIEADAVVICAGAWVNDFMPDYMKGYFRAQRQVQGWFNSEDPAFHIDNYPNYIRFVGREVVDYFYGFPANNQDGVKVARENGVMVDPNNCILRDTYDGEADSLYNFVQPHIRGLKPEFARAASCRYTLTPDQKFHIALHPESLDVYVVSACSGHGFKHSAALGDAIARAVAGRPAMQGVNLANYGWNNIPVPKFPALM